jgi:hypothetical protein
VRRRILHVVRQLGEHALDAVESDSIASCGSSTICKT